MSQRARKKRRQTRAGLAHGRAAYPRHTSRAGRTGGIHEKKTPPKRHEHYIGSPTRSIEGATRCPKCGAGPGEIHRHPGAGQ
jgi:hypothetical protein